MTLHGPILLEGSVPALTTLFGPPGSTRYSVLPGVSFLQVGFNSAPVDKIGGSPLQILGPPARKLTALWVQKTDESAGDIRLYLYEADENWNLGALVVASAVIPVMASGVYALTGLDIELAPGNYVVAMNSTDLALQFFNISGSLSQGVLTADRVQGLGTPVVASMDVGSVLVADAPPDPGPAYTDIGLSGSGSSYPVMLEMEPV